MNIKKTKTMIFSLNSLNDTNDYHIHLGNEIIDKVPVYKYLGIQVDCKLAFNCQFNETYKLASYKLSLLRRIRSYITQYTALTVVESMLLPYLDMGNLYFSSLIQSDTGKLDIILNSALRSVYNISNPIDVHNVTIYKRANLFSLSFRRKYFLLNLIHRLIHTGDIVMYQSVRETRRNIAPLVKTSVAINQTIAKSTVFVARSLWNSLSPDDRLIENHDAFKNIIRKNVNSEYLVHEIAKLTAGLFI